MRFTVLINVFNPILTAAALSLSWPLLKLLQEAFIVFMISLTITYGIALTCRELINFGIRIGLSRLKAKAVITSFLIAIVTICIYVAIFYLYPTFRLQMIDIINLAQDVKIADNLYSKITENQYLKSFFSLFSLDPTSIKTQINKFTAEIFDINFAESVKLTFFTLKSVIHSILVIILSVHMLKEWSEWRNKIIYLSNKCTPSNTDRVIIFIDNFNNGFQGWLLGQFRVSIILSLYYMICFYYLKLKGWVVLSLICGFSSFVPYLGDVVTILSIAFSLLVGKQIFLNIVVAVSCWVILGHCLGSYILTPVLIKKHAGVSPMQIIFGILLFSEFFGAFGLILNVPIWVIVNSFIQAFIFQEPQRQGVEAQNEKNKQ